MKLRRATFLLVAALLCGWSVSAQLAVSVLPVKAVGQKAVVQLKMKNNLADKIESARAACFLLDGQGKMIGQSTKWVIGQNKIGLDPKGKAKFNFVITNPQSLVSSNLTAKIVFSRVILDGGKMADPREEVEIIAATGDEKSKPH